MPFSPTQRRLGRSSDPSSSLPYCPQIRPAAADIPATLRYKFFESGLALLPQLPTCLHVHLFLLPSALPKPPKFLVLLEVKLLHAFESRALFKQEIKWGWGNLVCTSDLVQTGRKGGESSTDWSSNRSLGRKGKYRGNAVHSGMTRTRFAIHT